MFSVLVNIPSKESFWKKTKNFLKKKTFPWVEISVAVSLSTPPEQHNSEKGTELPESGLCFGRNLSFSLLKET